LIPQREVLHPGVPEGFLALQEHGRNTVHVLKTMFVLEFGKAQG